MKALSRLFGYLRFSKRDAIVSLSLAVVVSLLAGAQFPALIALAETLVGDKDHAEVRAFPDKLPQMLSFAKEPLRRFIDDVLVPHAFETLVWALVVLITLNFLKGLAVFHQEYAAGRVHTGVARRLAADLYDHVLGLSMSFYNRTSSPNIVSRFTNDVEAVGRGMAMLFGKVLLEPMLIAVFFVTAALINWQLLLYNLLLFPLLAFGIHALGRKSKRAMSKGLFGRDRMLTILQETFEGIVIVKAFNMERREEDRFRDENETIRRQDLKLAKADALTSPFVEFVGVLGAGLSFLLGAKMVIDGQMSAAMFVVFYSALGLMSGPVRKLSGVNNRLQMLVAASTRVFEFLDEKPDVVEKPDAQPLGRFSRQIRFENVSFTYTGETKVLDRVNIEAAKGEIVALVGPSGAGKTTIARLIPRFYDAAEGAVLIDGIDVREVTLASLRDQIGLVTQEVILFNDTIAANVAYGRPGATRDEIVQAARKANAADFIEKLPAGYESVIGEKGLTLSGGQRQRIALARAILKDPPILILDEATSSLDSESEHLIQQSMDAFMQNRTSMVIAHRLSTVKRASRIYVVDDGRIVASGTNEELLAKCAVYGNLYRRQFQLAATDAP